MTKRALIHYRYGRYGNDLLWAHLRRRVGRRRKLGAGCACGDCTRERRRRRELPAGLGTMRAELDRIGFALMTQRRLARILTKERPPRSDLEATPARGFFLPNNFSFSMNW